MSLLLITLLMLMSRQRLRKMTRKFLELILDSIFLIILCLNRLNINRYGRPYCHRNLVLNCRLKKTIILTIIDIDLDEFVKYLESKGIMCMAYGNVNNIMKLFLYSYNVYYYNGRLQLRLISLLKYR
jgi:hypothetical protein